MTQTATWVRLCRRWSSLVFREHFNKITPKVRSFRLLEESVELAQAEGATREEILIIVDQVMAKEPGNPFGELGGVLICAAAYASTRDMDMDFVFMSEFERIMDPAIMDRVRNRNLTGDKIGMRIDG